MSQYLGLTTDGLLFSGKNEEKFINAYKQKWAETMSNTYFQSETIDVGHKLRPRLVFWGYSANSVLFEDDNIENVAQIAVCIELIHKASLVLDDFIDKDTTRHSKPTFYMEHGVEKTIMYALNLLSKSLELLNKTYYNSTTSSFYYKSLRDITLTLQEMTLGVLKELDLSIETIMDIQEIKTIMNLETASLITNSLLMGFYLSNENNEELEILLKKVGKDLGYVFQLLNDMESFFSTKINEHKGSLNNDINRFRKNICLPVLFALMTKQDKKDITRNNHEFDETLLYKLLDKYNVKDILLEEIDSVIKNIKYEIEHSFIKQLETNWKNDFTCFIDSIVSVFAKRIK